MGEMEEFGSTSSECSEEEEEDMEGVKDVPEEQLDPVDDEEYRQLRSQVDLNPFDFAAHQNWILAEERRHERGSEPFRKGAQRPFPSHSPSGLIGWMPRSRQGGVFFRRLMVHELLDRSFFHW
jgi:hypothetical protein